MDTDWHRVAAVPVFGGLLAAALFTGEARVIVGAFLTLVWPFVFIWFGEDLAGVTGLHYGLVDRRSRPSLVRIGGWIVLAIYVSGIAYAAIRW